DLALSQLPGGPQRQHAGDLAEGVAPHAVGDRQGVGRLLGMGQELDGDAAQEHVALTAAADDQVAVLVRLPYLPGVRPRPELGHDRGAGLDLVEPADQVVEGDVLGRVERLPNRRAPHDPLHTFGRWADVDTRPHGFHTRPGGRSKDYRKERVIRRGPTTKSRWNRRPDGRPPSTRSTVRPRPAVLAIDTPRGFDSAARRRRGVYRGRSIRRAGSTP